ncbi:MAG: glycoside hydrolase [Gammaproteobacteria bacterium]|nr:glycoside hydrolase [Rhodocyclaceae bacterium]MBU3909490.1 glycoside hydrolase [Gammaproteobacteria bacterium]MBU3987787.1 glycoside hydrolase [Gammaproteobacteria bacterium]MBU4003745.1 glycoside hydrolase [Gammaproteobacteria bacterium]MBU4022202.1 glycoside hydrolase [Gammaproteobacteria bacterium]
MAAKPLDLVFLWHMHQPDYRDHASGTFIMPWTYLHAIKDYTDMAAHLERHPTIRAVVNFVPVLLDQLDDYIGQFASGEFRDPLLRLLATADLDALSEAERTFLFETCFRCNHATMLAPFSRYRRLHELYESLSREGEAALDYLSGAYLADLVTWYHLAWTGETERRREPLLAELMAKGEAFSLTDRQNLLAFIGKTLANLVPRYRALQERGQIELSTTPACHPLAPLLLDFKTARESQPEAALPLATLYPGGRERVGKHIVAAQESHARRFGKPALGLWPAEGALSAAFAQQLAAAGCRWTASGENVLQHSLGAPQAHAAHHPWQLSAAPGLTLFFRDDRLSDQIGFEYSKWHGRDAAAHFVAQLEAIAAAAPAGETPVVSIILDGENAWEYYPYNGYYFFSDLYELLEAKPALRTRTYADVLEAGSRSAAPDLPRLTAGSWVYGTLSTWIGDPAKNHAWDLLCAAKQSYDRVLASGRLSEAAATTAEAQLAICESSDWFWWFGDYNPAQAVVSFDRLFRRNLANLYRCLQLAPPVQLDIPISTGRSDQASVDAGGTMRRASGQSAPATQD